MIIARLQWHQGADAIKHIEKLAFVASAQDPKMLQDVQQVVYQSTVTHFASKGRPQWVERSESYKLWALKTYGTFWPPLLMTGKLMRTTLQSISSPWKKTGAARLLEIKSVWYGLVHQYGGERGSKSGGARIPKRPYIRLLADEKKKIKNIIKTAIKKA